MNEQDGDSPTLSISQEAGRTLAYLGQAAGRGLHALGLDGLYGVDDHEVGLHLLNMLVDFLERSLAEDIERRGIAGVLRETLGTQLDLACTLLAADIEHTAFGQAQHRLQDERALADTRLATQQHQAAMHQTASQDAVQLGIVHVHTRLRLSLYLAHRQRTRMMFQALPRCLQCGTRG